MDDFAAAFAAEDYPNAIAIWDSLAEMNYYYLVSESKEKYNPSLPAIIASFMPKSGGTFLFNRMIESVGYVDYYWGVTRHLSHSEVYPTSSSIDVYRRGGFFCHTHAVPSPYFRMVVEAKEVFPIWVHVRDPAEVTLAGYFHFQGVGQGEGPIRDKRVAEILEEKLHLERAHSLNFSSREQFMRDNIHFHASWLDSWVTYADENPGRVFFTYFEELDDPPKILKRVLHHYGLEVSLKDLPYEMPEDRRRKIGIRDWRHGLSDETVGFVNSFSSIWERALTFRNE